MTQLLRQIYRYARSSGATCYLLSSPWSKGFDPTGFPSQLLFNLPLAQERGGLVGLITVNDFLFAGHIQDIRYYLFLLHD